MHRKLISQIVERGTSDNMHKLKEIMCKMIDKLKMNDHDAYKEIEYNLYTIINGYHLNEELAKQWVADMVNKDGTHGEHWSIDQTQQYNDRHNKYEWYAIMNMMYSDYHNPKFNVTDYAEMAKNWFNDPDAHEGKTLRYYMLVVR